MLSFSNLSALLLIIISIAVVACIVSFYFAGKAENRRLNKADRRDEEILNTSNIGKVRIVSAEAPAKPEAPAPQVSAQPQPDAASGSRAGLGIEEITKEEAAQLEKEQEQKKLPQNIEINLVADADHPYRGEDIEALCTQYGILRGDLDIYYVYENPQARENEVFRMCSLKAPYSFPQDMSGFTTPALALYMNLPERGKAGSYFRAMLTAVEIFTANLGGTLQDNYHQPFTPEQIQDLEAKLQEYDARA